MSIKQNITLTRARTHALIVSLTDASGNPYVMSNDEFLIFGVKKNLSSNTYLVNKKIDSTATNDTEGQYIFEITPNDTANLTPDTYYWDIGLQRGTKYYSVVDTSRLVLEGNVTVKEG